MNRHSHLSPRSQRSLSLNLNIPTQGQTPYYGGPRAQSDREPDRRSSHITRHRAPSLLLPESSSHVHVPRGETLQSVAKVWEDFSCACSTDEWSDDVLEKIETLGSSLGIITHKVNDRRTDKVIARKTITTREAFKLQLLRQITVVASIKHPNIVTFLGAYISPMSCDLKVLTKFCGGGSLKSVGRLINGTNAVVSEAVAGRIAEGILQGLAHLHSLQITHGGVKPSNILFNRDGVVKLCDFALTEDFLYVGSDRLCGLYIAPERLSGKGYGIQADVWSAGLSLLEFVQKSYPYPGHLPTVQLIMHITTNKPPRLVETRPDVQWSEPMKDFFAQSLEFEATNRPTPADLLTHPWIVGVMRKEDKMRSWIRQVRRMSIITQQEPVFQPPTRGPLNPPSSFTPDLRRTRRRYTAGFMSSG